jgi:hypothetical protein
MNSEPLMVAASSPEGAYDPKSVKEFDQAASTLRGVLQDLHCTSGTYTIVPSRRIRNNPKWARVSVRGESTSNRDRSFIVRIRPNDNEILWEYILTVPAGVSASILQDQIVSHGRRCAASAIVNPESVTDEPDFQQRGPAADLRPVTPASHPQPEPTTPSAENASPALKSINDLFQRMQSAIIRKEDREARSKAITKLINTEKKHIAEASARINSLENELLAIMHEDEQDGEYRQAAALVGTINALTNGHAQSQLQSQ